MTPQQLRLLALLTDTDMKPAELGVELGISEHTVRMLIGDLYADLGVHSRPHLRSVMLECELAGAG